jgi:hypothetical protein
MATVVWLIALQGCVGLAAGTYGKTESAYPVFYLQPDRYLSGSSVPAGGRATALTEAQVIEAWGAPDEKTSDGHCTVLRYRTGTAWSGAGIFVGFFPIPAVAPTGSYFARIYLRDGFTVGAVAEYGNVLSAAGVACGSEDCTDAAKHNTNAPDAARKDVDTWCAEARASAGTPEAAGQ